MKGVIFNVLEEMVIDQCGMQAWNEILDQLVMDGIYTAGESYPDSELFRLVQAISDKTGIATETLVGAFGEFLFDRLQQRYPMFVESEPDLRSFLMSVDGVIHIEVKKLFDNPNLPSFSYLEISDKELLMRYSSPRKLCLLAEGLIRGAAKHYQESITIKHPVCMHNGAEHCDLIIGFE